MESDCGFFVVVDLHGFADWASRSAVMARSIYSDSLTSGGAGTKDVGAV